jgi:hypothetical protein
VYIIALCSSIYTTTFFSLYVRCCPVLNLTSYTIAKSLGHCPPYKFIFRAMSVAPEEDSPEMAVLNTLKPNDPGHPLRQKVARMDEPPQLQQLRDLEAALMASSYWAKLKKHLLKPEAKVDNIVCVVLGDVVTSEGTFGPPTNVLSPRSASQNLLATLICRLLSECYAEVESPTTSIEPKVPIPIVAFDPDYSSK